MIHIALTLWRVSSQKQIELFYFMRKQKKLITVFGVMFLSVSIHRIQSQRKQIKIPTFGHMETGLIPRPCCVACGPGRFSTAHQVPCEMQPCREEIENQKNSQLALETRASGYGPLPP